MSSPTTSYPLSKLYRTCDTHLSQLSELAATALSSSVIMYLRDSLTSRIFQSGVDWESFSASSGMKVGKMLSFLAFLSFGWNTLLISTSLRA